MAPRSTASGRATASLAQLGRRPGLRAGGAGSARRPRGAGEASWQRRRGRAHGQRRRLGPLVHRGGDDRRHDDRRRRAQRGDRRRPASGLVKVGGRHRARRPQRGAARARAWRWRTSATSTARRSPGRSRPAPTAPAPGCATSPPRSRRSSWSSPTARCAS